ncbi:hypothetical protein ABZ402_45265 [Streptomyces mirabilis]|uniref:ATP-dependent DNA ligase n=1 Tax=Streptomyces mirabilis TaxID=68239 RepID=UPI0033D04C1C
MDWPVSVALAQSVPELPTGADWSYEVKLDGHRMIMWRTDDGVRLQARSGRDVTAVWGDLALASHHLPAGTVLDGEAVITTEDGRISFEDCCRTCGRVTAISCRRVGEERHAKVDQLRAPVGGGPVEAGELGHGGGEADLESFDLAAPSRWRGPQ